MGGPSSRDLADRESFLGHQDASRAWGGRPADRQVLGELAGQRAARAKGERRAGRTANAVLVVLKSSLVGAANRYAVLGVELQETTLRLRVAEQSVAAFNRENTELRAEAREPQAGSLRGVRPRAPSPLSTSVVIRDGGAMSTPVVFFVLTDVGCGRGWQCYPGIPIFFGRDGVIEPASDYMIHVVVNSVACDDGAHVCGLSPDFPEALEFDWC